jgi:hypothetical protein
MPRRYAFPLGVLLLVAGAGCGDSESTPRAETARSEPSAELSVAPAAAPPLAASTPNPAPAPETMTPAEIWSELVALENSVHERIGRPRKSVEGMVEIAREVERMGNLIEALPARLQHPNEDEQIRIERLARNAGFSVEALHTAAESMVPGRLLMPMHEQERWLVTLEQGLPRDQIGDARVREPEKVDWNKVR